ncbi:MAG: AsmA-like C-terminal region-containing protein [Vicingaceae bacterium]
MKTLLKIVGGLIVIIVLALILVPIIFKDDIVKIVKEETNNAVNAKVEFGEFDLSLIKSFPDFFFVIEDVSVTGINEFEGVKLADIKELDLTVDLMSVINGESINVKQITIIEPYIEAKVLADGKANWDIAKESEAGEEVEEVETEEAASFKMELKNISIQKGRVIYDDATLPMHMDINQLNLGITGNMTEAVTTLDSKGSVESFNLTFDGVKYMNEVKVMLDALIEMNLEEMKFTFKENELRANELPLAFDGWLAMPNESIDMDISYAAKETEFKHLLSMIPAEFAKDLEGVKTSGTLALDGYVKGSYLDSIYPGFGVNMMVNNAMFQYPDLPKSVDEINIEAHVDCESGDLDETIVDVPKFHLMLADNPFDLNFYLATPLSDPYIRAGMKGKVVLDNIKDVVPLEKGDELSGTITSDFSLAGNLSTIEQERYEEFKAEGQLIVENIHYKTDSLDYPVDLHKADMVFSPRFVELKQLDMNLGKSDMSMDGRLENFIGYALKDDQTLIARVNFRSKLMDINELAGIDPNAEETEEESTETDTTATDEPMEAVLLPKHIDFVAKARIGELIFDNMNIKQIDGGISLKEEKMKLQETSMNLLGGSMMMNGLYETTDSLRPAYDFEMKIKDFDVQQTVQTMNTVEKLAPIAKKSEGQYNTQLSIKGALTKQMDPIYESMFGSGSLQTSNIQVKDYKPLKKVADAIKYNKINPLSLKDANLNFKITEGKVYVDPFDIKVGDSKVTIAGSNSFDQTIDYTFSFAIPRKEFGGSANKAVDGLLAQASNKGIDIDVADVINVDVRLVGPASDPEIKTDFKKAASNATDALKKKAEEEFNKKKEELEKKAREELEKKKKEAEEKAKEEIEKAKKKAEEELEKKKKEAEEKLKDEAKKKLKGLFGG